jgi:hypothetical protein
MLALGAPSMQGRRSHCSRPGLRFLDTHSLKGTLKPLTPGHHHLWLHRRRADEAGEGREDAGHRADTVVGPRETPRFLLGARARGPVRLCWEASGGKGGESVRERAAVSLNGKDRLSLQLSLITFPTILFSVLSPSPEQAEAACSRAQRGRGFPGALPMWPRLVVEAGPALAASRP